jgi:DNA-binding response OmpR family regulator
VTTTKSTRTKKRPRILLAHPDAVWVDQAKRRLEEMGYSVTDCLEMEWVADLLGGSRPFDLAAVSSELDPASQASILRSLTEKGGTTKLVMLLDALDSASMHYRAKTGFLTYRVSPEGIAEFALLVASQVGVPAKPADAP